VPLRERSTVRASGRAAAYLDVDGTLTTGVTLFELLRFDAAERGVEHDGDAFLREIDALRAAGIGRVERNRHLFRWWGGRRVVDVEAVGERWFAAALRDGRPGGLLRPRVVARVERHRHAGDVIVLVSGSFAPALAPVARALGGADLLVTAPQVRDGRYTGHVAHPMIGDEKARAVALHARRERISLGRSAAYGDDLSDVGYMDLTGHPTVVAAPGAPLTRLGRRRGWGVVVV
jgi:HAD superfamily hydrolase (TIGR01490 family)